MRLSVDPEDPGYSLKAAIAKIIFNGEPVGYVFTADEEQGTILVQLFKDDGTPEVNEDGSAVIVELEGQVQITFPTLQ